MVHKSAVALGHSVGARGDRARDEGRVRVGGDARQKGHRRVFQVADGARHGVAAVRDARERDCLRRRRRRGRLGRRRRRWRVGRRHEVGVMGRGGHAQQKQHGDESEHTAASAAKRHPPRGERGHRRRGAALLPATPLRGAAPERVRLDARHPARVEHRALGIRVGLGAALVPPLPPRLRAAQRRLPVQAAYEIVAVQRRVLRGGAHGSRARRRLQ